MPSDIGIGPRGDFYPRWNYTDGSNQPYQKAGDSWNVNGPAGSNYTTYDWTKAGP